MRENPEMISEYTDDNIKTLEWNKHIRQRAGMYIGNLGGGTNPGDGIYILLKEIIDNSIDEFSSGFGKQINVTIDGRKVTVRDFGRGIPLDSVVKRHSRNPWASTVWVRKPSTPFPSISTSNHSVTGNPLSPNIPAENS